MMRKSSITAHVTERSLLTLGLVLLGLYGLAQVLHAAGIEKSPTNKPAGYSASALKSIDYSLWAPARITAYKKSLGQHKDPLAILKIPKVRIVAPVLDGTDDLTLNAGVGRIPGTAHPGQEGNIGIAGHRDSFFRALKNVVKGDKIELDTANASDIYVVSKAYVAKPNDVNILKSGPTSAITLVTCYPFYYKGMAPQRYIVQAVKQQAKAATKRERISAAN